MIEAINRVKRDLPGIGKVDTSPQLEYAYRGIETLTAHLQGLTARHGIVVVPDSVKAKEVVEFTVKSGATWTETRITFGWAVYGPGGVDDVIFGESVGHGRDRDDRGGSKAMTQAYKEFLIKLFCIGDKSTDPDHASTGEEGERFDAGGRIIGSGQPPTIDWRGLGWSDMEGALSEDERNAAKARHDGELRLISDALQALDEDTRAKLMETRKRVIGALPLSKAQVHTWSAMADAALLELENAAAGVAEAFPGTTEA